MEGHGPKPKLFSAGGQGMEYGHTCWLVLGKEDVMDSALDCSLCPAK